MDNDLIKSYAKICENLKIIDRVYANDKYIKVGTNILLGSTDTYLNLYIIFEDGDVCLSDSNEVYRICDGYYDLTDEILAEFASQVGLDYEGYRFTKYVTPLSLESELLKFEKLKDLICSL